jgi:hypothetical protein
MDQKKIVFVKTKVVILAFAKTQPITPQNTTHPNHHSSSGVVLLTIDQYTMHT